MTQPGGARGPYRPDPSSESGAAELFDQLKDNVLQAFERTRGLTEELAALRQERDSLLAALGKVNFDLAELRAREAAREQEWEALRHEAAESMQSLMRTLERLTLPSSAASGLPQLRARPTEEADTRRHDYTRPAETARSHEPRPSEPVYQPEPRPVEPRPVEMPRPAEPARQPEWSRAAEPAPAAAPERRRRRAEPEPARQAEPEPAPREGRYAPAGSPTTVFASGSMVSMNVDGARQEAPEAASGPAEPPVTTYAPAPMSAYADTAAPTEPAAAARADRRGEEAGPATTQVATEPIMLTVAPFTRFTALAEFERALHDLPDVQSVRIRRFHRGVLSIAVEYNGVVPLATRLTELRGFPLRIRSATPEAIEAVVVDRAGFANGHSEVAGTTS